MPVQDVLLYTRCLLRERACHLHEGLCSMSCYCPIRDFDDRERDGSTMT
jgi:hypothetical protein